MTADAIQTLLGLLIAAAGVAFMDWRAALVVLGLGLYALGAATLWRRMKL